MISDMPRERSILQPDFYFCKHDCTQQFMYQMSFLYEHSENRHFNPKNGLLRLLYFNACDARQVECRLFQIQRKRSTARIIP